MLFPKGNRYNFRYRGPKESKKMYDFYSDISTNIDTLKTAFNDIENKFQAIQNSTLDINYNDSKYKINSLFDKVELL